MSTAVPGKQLNGREAAPTVLFRSRLPVALAFAGLACLASSAAGQAGDAANLSGASSLVAEAGRLHVDPPVTAAEADLPNAPGLDLGQAELRGSSSSSVAAPPSTDAEVSRADPSESFASGYGGQGSGHPGTASPYDKYILPSERPPRLTPFDKTLLSLRHTATPFAGGGWILISAYEQIVDSNPNYGETAKGYMQRLGAAAARGSSDEIFSDAILASVLREDPRYYRLGDGHSFLTRLFYAGTRGLVTRTDSGTATINLASLGGNLAGAALTPAYYPPLNRNFGQVMKTYGGSLAGTAFGNIVAEFLSDSFYRKVHLKHPSD